MSKNYFSKNIFEEMKADEEIRKLIEHLKSRYAEICNSLDLSPAFRSEIEAEIEKLLLCDQRDFIVSRGEFLNAKIMAEYLGYEFIDAKELIYFDSSGKLDEEKTYRAIEKRVGDKKNVVIPGFYGIDKEGNIKTFERGGSDITGSIMARGLSADLYENWTDVSGIMTADPRKDKSATTIEHLSYEELMKITQDGAQVYHKDAIKPAQEKNIPIQIKNTNKPEDEGTMISDTKKKMICVALLGFGTVGKGVEAILRENAQQISSRLKETTGEDAHIVIKKILVKDRKKHGNVPKKLLADNFDEILKDDSIDIVVELIGGDEDAREFMIASMQNKKHVVTANKLAIAAAKGELEEIAQKNKVEFLFEASVGGAIPIIRTINESLEGNRILELSGIINGTTNYILSSMTKEGTDYEEALKNAQALGFAEADPTSDVEGYDSVYKMCILCKQCFGEYPKPEHITREGICELTKEQLELAKQNHTVVKLIGRAFLKDGEPHVAVEPMEVPKELPLAHVDGAGNAIQISCDNAGVLFLQGQGAGSRPTASAVVSDIINIARMLLKS